MIDRDDGPTWGLRLSKNVRQLGMLQEPLPLLSYDIGCVVGTHGKTRFASSMENIQL